MKVTLPDYLRKFKKEAADIIKNHCIKDIEFSGATYQILVEDPNSHEEYWVFMQLDGQGGIKDAFCSCEEIHEHTGCLHAAGAYLSLFKQFSQPLHQRFARSLWNQLCRLYEERLGDDPKALSKLSEAHFVCHSRLGKVIFSIKGLKEETGDILDKILFKREAETEETSLKFSNLSSEEIISWREGKPNPQLRFDLSFWSDLAKWLMKKQEEGEKYQLTFKYSKKNLPNWLQIDFEDVEVGFYLSEANLPLLIESLKTVKSPLAVYHAQQKEIGQIIYDKHEHVLHVIEKSEEEASKKKKDKEFNVNAGIALDGWLFIPGDGFYAEETHELLRTPQLHGEDIVLALTDHTRLISSLIVGCSVHREPVALSYQLHFDQRWNLHVHAYLFNYGDLDEGDSWLIENWAYLDDDGFYPIEGNLFDGIETFIPFLQVSDFVTHNRSWLNTQEGFHTHVRSIEYQLSYQLTPNNRLIFTRNITKSQDEAKQQDFGVWVYLEGFGFYSKTAGSFNYLLKSGVSLSPEQIPLFIKMNYEELSLIPKFFNSRCPVAKAGLRVVFSDKKKVLVAPDYELLPAFQGKTPLIFDDFIYLEGEGFYELPNDLRLPEKYRTEVELDGEELVAFISYELESLMKNVVEIDPRLLKPQQCRLVTNFIEPSLEKGRGWYNFRLFYQTEAGQIPLPALRQAMNKKFPFAFFQAGLIDLRDRQFEWVKLLNKDRFEKGSDKVLLSTLDYMRLNAFDPIELLKEGQKEELSSAATILDDLTHLQTPTEPNIEGLVSHLRPYQEIGVHWLWFLYTQQLSGLLCDDMGLGKTIRPWHCLRA